MEHILGVIMFGVIIAILAMVITILVFPDAFRRTRKSISKMDTKSKTITYGVTIAIVAVVFVRVVWPDSFAKAQNSILGAFGSVTGNSYTDVIAKLFKSIDNEDEDKFVSLFPFDYEDYSQTTITREDAIQMVKMYMPCLTNIYGEKAKLAYNITDVKEYSNTELAALIDSGEIDSGKSKMIKAIVKVSVKMTYERDWWSEDHNAEFTAYKINGKWYLDYGRVRYYMDFIVPTQYGDIQVKPEYRRR